LRFGFFASMITLVFESVERRPCQGSAFEFSCSGKFGPRAADALSQRTIW
jgi:hypothetical protein